MGTGVNAQKKLVALHHLDPDTYLPSNIEQCEGRIVRQGNSNSEIQLYAYVTKGSYDETMWQFLETKQRFIDQFLSGEAAEDEATDIDGGADSFAMARAMSSDNPLILERAGIESDIQRLESLRRAHFDDQQRLKVNNMRAEENIPHYRRQIAALEKVIAKRSDSSGDKFELTLNGSTFDERKDAGEALAKAIDKMLTSPEKHDLYKKVGEVAGLDIMVRSGISLKVPWVTLEVGANATYSSSLSFQGLDSVESIDPVGVAMKLENMARSFDKNLSGAQEQLAKDEKLLNDSSARIGRSFEHAETLSDKKKRLDEIETILKAEEKQAESPEGQGENVHFALAPENKNVTIDRTSKIKEGYYVPERLPARYEQEGNKGALGTAAAISRGIHEAVRRGEISGSSAWERHQQYKELAENYLKPQETTALRQWAEAQNLIIDAAEFDRQWAEQGSKKGEEHRVYLSPDGTRIFKRNNLLFGYFKRWTNKKAGGCLSW